MTIIFNRLTVMEMRHPFPSASCRFPPLCPDVPLLEFISSDALIFLSLRRLSLFFFFFFPCLPAFSDFAPFLRLRLLFLFSWAVACFSSHSRFSILGLFIFFSFLTLIFVSQLFCFVCLSARLSLLTDS